ncbi:hypothetical protein [Bradyrhizobium sp. sBnM-33]|uniref:hypothetical protein n=2 Tax=Bradyrhizobium sp. sBnM-33 TaxID=2831780 RepID=UPI001BD15AE0|nr:hypothetical protein [Bradyrhizobium sp. sBnM-33]
MRMGTVMMRLSNLYLTPAQTGLVMLTVLLLGAIVVQVIIVSEHSEVRTHTSPENGGRVTLDIGVADLRASLP